MRTGICINKASNLPVQCDGLLDKVIDPSRCASIAPWTGSRVSELPHDLFFVAAKQQSLSLSKSLIASLIASLIGSKSLIHVYLTDYRVKLKNRCSGLEL
jgi:hypothetical protein